VPVSFLLVAFSTEVVKHVYVQSQGSKTLSYVVQLTHKWRRLNVLHAGCFLRYASFPRSLLFLSRLGYGSFGMYTADSVKLVSALFGWSFVRRFWVSSYELDSMCSYKRVGPPLKWSPFIYFLLLIKKKTMHPSWLILFFY